MFTVFLAIALMSELDQHPPKILAGFEDAASCAQAASNATHNHAEELATDEARNRGLRFIRLRMEPDA